LISAVSGTEIRAWLQGLDHETSKVDASAPRRAVANRTRNNFRLCIQTLFMFAKAQRYLPSDWDELGSVPQWKVKGQAVEIFTAEEMTLLLALAPANLVPFLAIGGFAGLRTAEIERLDWSKVDLEGGYITVDASIAKTNSRRLVPIAPNLKAWLAGHKRPHGPVLELANVVNAVNRVVRAARGAERAEDGGQRAEDGGRKAGWPPHPDPLPLWRRGRVPLEAQRAAAFVLQLPAGGDQERGPGVAGGREQSADDLPALP
jgi:integrase